VAQATQKFPIVGIGASAGGLEAFTELLQNLPADTGMAFVLVQHLDPTHESQLTNLLARATVLPVRQVQNNMSLEPNQVYVIPPNAQMTTRAGVLKLVEGRRTGEAHHSIDHFFESLACDRGWQAIGVILSGSASDGALGLEAIKNEGGIAFAQGGSAKFDSMLSITV
jgi:two-component system, chemotaxis family, CheB/CheR fusion protein